MKGDPKLDETKILCCVRKQRINSVIASVFLSFNQIPLVVQLDVACSVEINKIHLHLVRYLNLELELHIMIGPIVSCSRYQ